MQQTISLIVLKAINAKYINAVCNCITGQLPANIRLIMNHLFTTYRKITKHELQGNYDETLKIT